MRPNPSLPQDLFHHSQMLADTHRIDRYAQALKQRVREDDCVLDAGSGTGVLAALASPLTKNTVYAVEYFENTSAFASRSFAEAQNSNVVAVNSTTYGRPVEAEPNLLVTETIGALGPEENILEICYELKRRYPSLREIIPTQLAIYAVPIRSGLVQESKDAFVRPFIANSNQSLNFSWALTDIERVYASELHGGELSSAEVIQPPVRLASYRLGESLAEDISVTLTDSLEKADAVHLYFEAELADDVILSSAWNQPLTHWQHRYVFRPGQAQSLKIGYHAKDHQWSFQWS